ncbi:fumarylacetoacetate hydrolase domain-containing protein 2 [Podospora australis]|uniref:Fumarylacetoacetate hydrolase domain-containing protein 2 n=1 Tax=Podospora australis TaxID=1536484 RepID=A0AAN6WUL9_9PEZI|nr:fumarylacetoacetate hydrolase domain-containing protein 2 [Podospora australis]
MYQEYDNQMRDIYRAYINGCHILHNHGVLDAYGHLSVRHPVDRNVFIMSRNMAPALVSSPSDLIQYEIEEARPLNPANVAESYLERFIHAAIFKLYADINAVVHSHAEAVLPFTISRVRLKPCFHLAGFLKPHGQRIFEMNDYGELSEPDLLIKNQRLGLKLSYKFNNMNSVVLMRGHGFTAVAGSIESAVFKAIYTVKNAEVQTNAMNGQSSAASTRNFPIGGDPGINYLSEKECKAGEAMAEKTLRRAWDLWVREVEVQPLYRNMLHDQAAGQGGYGA